VHYITYTHDLYLIALHSNRINFIIIFLSIYITCFPALRVEKSEKAVEIENQHPENLHHINAKQYTHNRHEKGIKKTFSVLGLEMSAAVLLCAPSCH